MSSQFCSFEQLEYQVSAGTAFIRLNRPEALNSFTSKLYSEVKDAFRLSMADDNVDIIVITGSGRAFATGGDLHEVLERIEDANPLALYAYDDHMPFETIKHCSKTTIAAVNGICVAGGLALASCCDLLADPAVAILALGLGNDARLDWLASGWQLVDDA